MQQEVVVVIPVYQQELKWYEQISLNRCLEVLGRYPIVFLCPDGLFFDYDSTSRDIPRVSFPKSYFTDVKNYNRLMLSEYFYKRFYDYKKILIYQLDAFVFSDRLQEFCALDYDYIGAPWVLGLGRQQLSGHGWVLAHVGNGGFSLRDTKACLHLLRTYPVESDMPEDKFFGILGKVDKEFRVAPISTAYDFSAEYDAERVWRKNHYTLPFGCHAWQKYSADFYVWAFAQVGIDLSGARQLMYDADMIDERTLVCLWRDKRRGIVKSIVDLTAQVEKVKTALNRQNVYLAAESIYEAEPVLRPDPAKLSEDEIFLAKHLDALLYHGITDIEQKRYNQAARYLKAWQRLTYKYYTKQCPELYHYLGQAYEGMKLPEMARHYYQMDGNHIQAASKADLLVKKYQEIELAKDIIGRADCMLEAIHLMHHTELPSERETLTRFFQSRTKILILAAFEAVSKGEGQDAEQYLSAFPEQAIQVIGVLPSYRYWYGRAAYEQKDWDRAICEFEAYLESHPTDELALFYLGNTYVHKRDWEKALSSFWKVVQRNHSFIEARINIAHILCEIGETDMADRLMEQQSEYALSDSIPFIEHEQDLDIAQYETYPKQVFDIPIFINSRDRLSMLQQQIGWFLQAGYHNIHILDNDSTYTPLKQYYTKLEQHGIHVWHLNKNLGYKALWRSNILEILQIRTPYVYTDSDIVPDENCPYDVVLSMLKILRQHSYLKKVGIALRSDDITYYDKEYIQKKESGLKMIPVTEGYFAAVDTTMALYRNWRHYSLQESFRTGEHMQARHLPWYSDYENLSEDEQYYMEHANQSSTLVQRWQKDTI